MKYNYFLFILLLILPHKFFAQGFLDSAKYSISVMSGNENRIITMGYNPFGTDGIDSILGEENLPPYVQNQFDARFRLFDTTQSSYTDIRYGCGWAAGQIHIIEWKYAQNPVLKGGRMEDHNVMFIEIKDFNTGESLYQLGQNDSLFFNIPTGYSRLVLEIGYHGTLSWPNYSSASIEAGDVIAAGTIKEISWTIMPTSIMSTDILFSSDNGITWNSVAMNIPYNQNSYSWSVPDIYSNKCIIRLGDYPCIYADYGTFLIYQGSVPQLEGSSVSLSLKNGNNETINLTAGLHPDATSGLDTALGEVLHSFAPAGIFDAALRISYYNYGQHYSRINYQSGHHFVYGKRTFDLKINPSADSIVYIEASLPQDITAELEYADKKPFGWIWEKKFLGSGSISYLLPKTSLSENYNFRLNFFFDRAVPVELLSFSANVLEKEVQLNWITATETNNSGFEVQRLIRQSSKDKINGNWEIIGFIEGNGTTTEKSFYSFVDKDINSGKYSYRLKQIDYDGSFEYSKEIEVEIGMPKEFALYQNYPNPFNPLTKIKFTIPDFGFTSLKIYDVLGNEVATLVNEEKQPGEYEIDFDAGKYSLSSGVYFYQLKTGSFIQTNKMILMR